MTNMQKKCANCTVCIVHTDADVVDCTTRGRAVRHMEGVGWQDCGQVDTWPTQWPPRVTLGLV
jgi:hypothetical protein